MNKISIIPNVGCISCASIFNTSASIFYGHLFKKHASKSFTSMIQNINNGNHFKSFLSQQPMISYFLIEEKHLGCDEDILQNKVRYNFNYGSWELQSINIPNEENQTVVYRLKEKYILNEETKESLNNFYENTVSNKISISDRIISKESDERLVCFNKKNSKMINFLTGKYGQYLYTILDAFNWGIIYENLFIKQADKYVEILVEKKISMNEAEFQYKFNKNAPGINDLLPGSEYDGIIKPKGIAVIFLLQLLWCLTNVKKE